MIPNQTPVQNQSRTEVMRLTRDDKDPLPLMKSTQTVHKCYQVSQNRRDTLIDRNSRVEDRQTKAEFISCVPGRNEKHADGQEATRSQVSLNLIIG
jgi:hypothetical protein